MADGKPSPQIDALVAKSKALGLAGRSLGAESAQHGASANHSDSSNMKQAVNDRSNDSEAIVLLCESCLRDGDNATVTKALQVATKGSYSSESASKALGLLCDLQSDSKNTSRAALVEAMLKNDAGRKALATLMIINPSSTFMQIWSLGLEARTAMINVCLDPETWPDSKERSKVTKDVLLLLLSLLIQPGGTAETDAESLQIIARLFALNPSGLDSLIDKDNLAIILSFLDIEKPVLVRSQATLAAAKFLEASCDRGQSMLSDYVTSRIGSQANDDVVAAFSAAGAVFPIVPDVASSLFLTPGFVENLARVVRKSQSNRLRHSALELLSAACINKSCRQTIHAICCQWLEDVVRNGLSDKDAALAALVLSKTNHESEHDVSKQVGSMDNATLVRLYKDIIMQTDRDEKQIAVEGLAYSSTQSPIKENLANDQPLLRKLSELIVDGSNRGSLAFGGLTVFSNLCTYPPNMTAEQRRMVQLKAYANQSRPAEPSPFDNTAHVNARCKTVLDAGFVTVLKQAAKSASPTLLGLICSIALSLSRERKHCGIMIQQGVMDLLMPIALYGGSDAALVSAQKSAAQAFARCIIPVNPSLVFRDQPARSVAGAVRILQSILDDKESQDPRPAFEALQALTNLASMGDEVSNHISEAMFLSVERYLSSPLSAQQQAATECLSNLTISEGSISRFVVDSDQQPEFPKEFNGETELAHAKEFRFLLLRALTEDPVRGTRLAAMASLFNITLVDAGVRMLMHCPSGLERLMEQMPSKRLNVSGGDSSTTEERDLDMDTRTVGVLLNVLQQGGEAAKARLISLRLETRLVDVQSSDEQSQLNQFVKEVLQTLKVTA